MFTTLAWGSVVQQPLTLSIVEGDVLRALRLATAAAAALAVASCCVIPSEQAIPRIRNTVASAVPSKQRLRLAAPSKALSPKPLPVVTPASFAVPAELAAGLDATIGGG